MAINYLPADTTQGLVFEEPQRLPQLPEGKLVAYDGKNIMPTVEGYKSFFGVTNRIGDSTLPADEIQEIISFVTPFGQIVLIALCGDGLWMRSSEGDGTATITETSTEYLVDFTATGKFSWTKIVPLSSANKWKLWTKVILNNRAFFYANGLGFIIEVTSEFAGKILLKKLEPTYIISNVAKQHKIQIVLKEELGNSTFKSIQIDGSVYTKYVSREADMDDFLERIRDSLGGGDISGKNLSVTKGKWTFDIPELAVYTSVGINGAKASGSPLQDFVVTGDPIYPAIFDKTTRHLTPWAVQTINDLLAIAPTAYSGIQGLLLFNKDTGHLSGVGITSISNFSITAWNSATYSVAFSSINISAIVSWLNANKPYPILDAGGFFSDFFGLYISVYIPDIASTNYPKWIAALEAMYEMFSTDLDIGEFSYFKINCPSALYYGSPITKLNIFNYDRFYENSLGQKKLRDAANRKGAYGTFPFGYTTGAFNNLPISIINESPNEYLNFINPALFGSNAGIAQLSVNLSGAYGNIEVTHEYIRCTSTSMPLYAVIDVDSISAAIQVPEVLSLLFLSDNGIKEDLWLVLEADPTEPTSHGGVASSVIRIAFDSISDPTVSYVVPFSAEAVANAYIEPNYLIWTDSSYGFFRPGIKMGKRLKNPFPVYNRYVNGTFTTSNVPLLYNRRFDMTNMRIPIGYFIWSLVNSAGNVKLTRCSLHTNSWKSGLKGIKIESFRHKGSPVSEVNINVPSTPPQKISVSIPSSLSTSQQVIDHVYTGLQQYFPLTTVTKNSDPEATLQGTITKEYLTYDGHIPTVALTKDGTETGESISVISSTNLKMAEVDGIFKARGRLGAWRYNGSIHLSSPTNYMDFVPSISTQANELRVESVRGDIIQVLGAGEGFTLFNSGNIVRANYNGEQNSFVFAELYPVGISDPRHITSLAGTTYFYSPVGLLRSAGSQIEKVDYALVDYLNKFKIPVKLLAADDRYLIIEISEEYLDNLFFDRAIRDGGATKYPEEYSVPSASSIGFLSRQPLDLKTSYIKAYIYDIQLNKWGVCNTQHKALIGFSPWNLTSELISIGDGTYTPKLGQIGSDGKTYIFDEANMDSYIIYGKWGLSRRGKSRLTRVDVGFTKLPKARVAIESSFEGSRIDFSDVQQSEEITKETRETLHFHANGKWHNVRISGIFDLNFLNVGGFVYGR